jgi:hypothetical protein
VQVKVGDRVKGGETVVALAPVKEVEMHAGAGRENSGREAR